MTTELGRLHAEAIKRVLARRAQHGPGGRPSRCHPPNPRAARKVIFSTEQAARAAERELADEAGALRQDVYHCRYADHWHLTKWRREEP